MRPSLSSLLPCALLLTGAPERWGRCMSMPSWIGRSAAFPRTVIS